MRYLTFRIAILACASAALLTAQALPAGYDPDSEITTTGVVEQTIERIDNGMSSTRAVIVSPIGGNKRYLVELGPGTFMDKSPVILHRGDRIEVTGSLKGGKYMDTIIARDIKDDGRTLALRDSAGQPLWAADSEQFRPRQEMMEERARTDPNAATVDVDDDNDVDVDVDVDDNNNDVDVDIDDNDIDDNGAYDSSRSREMVVTNGTTVVTRDEEITVQHPVLPSRIGGPEAVGASGQPAPLSWADTLENPPYGIIPRAGVIEERGRAGEAAPVSYNPQTETTISGKVTDIRDATGGKGFATGTHLVLATDDGRLMNVHVGPSGSFTRERIDSVRGQRVTVTGSRVQANGADMILARQVSMNGQAWQLRDKAGVPLPLEQR